MKVFMNEKAELYAAEKAASTAHCELPHVADTLLAMLEGAKKPMSQEEIQAAYHRVKVIVGDMAHHGEI